MVCWATVLLMTRRLARRGDLPVIQGWGQLRPATPEADPAPARTLCQQFLSGIDSCPVKFEDPHNLRRSLGRHFADRGSNKYE